MGFGLWDRYRWDIWLIQGLEEGWKSNRKFQLVVHDSVSQERSQFGL